MAYIPNPLIIPIGMLIGVLIALPIGPVNLLGLQRAVERGFFGGMAMGIGIMLGDGLIALGAAMGVNALSGAIRQSGHMATRLKEANKLGFKSAVVPAVGEIDADAYKMKLYRSGHLQNIVTGMMKKAK